MKGIAYGVGVGPGDPEYMTLKACRLIRENEIIAVPGKVPQESVAYQIAAGAVPEIAEKTLVPVWMPMVKDREKIDAQHQAAAKLFETYLDRGENVVFLTLGDSTIYCTFSYIQHYLEADGYTVELVSGITSFCAAAARLGVPLVEWDEQLHILSGQTLTMENLRYPGTLVIMKCGRRMEEIKAMLVRLEQEEGAQVLAVEECGSPEEKHYLGAAAIPADSGYMTTIIVKKRPDVVY